MKNLKDFIVLIQKVDSTILDELIDCIKDDNFNERLDKLELEFAKIMVDKEICKPVIETLLKIEISDINYIEEQKEIQNRRNSKTIKVDIVR